MKTKFRDWRQMLPRLETQIFEGKLVLLHSPLELTILFCPCTTVSYGCVTCFTIYFGVLTNKGVHASVGCSNVALSELKEQ